MPVLESIQEKTPKIQWQILFQDLAQQTVYNTPVTPNREALDLTI